MYKGSSVFHADGKTAGKKLIGSQQRFKQA
jgi:hypothetical protein